GSSLLLWIGAAGSADPAELSNFLVEFSVGLDRLHRLVEGALGADHLDGGLEGARVAELDLPDPDAGEALRHLPLLRRSEEGAAHLLDRPLQPEERDPSELELADPDHAQAVDHRRDLARG